MHKRFLLAAVLAAAAVVCPAQAKLTSTCSSSSQVGNGVTRAFTFPCKFLQNSDVSVTVNQVAKTQPGDYTVSGAGNATGTITFGVAPASGALVVITRTVDNTQQTSLGQNKKLDPSTVESALDKLTMQVQQVDARVPGGTAAATTAYVDNAIAATVTGGLVVQPVSWSLTGDGATTAFSIPNAATNSPDLYIATIDGVYQKPTTDYTVSVASAQITFTAAPALNAVVAVRSFGYARALSVGDSTSVLATGSLVPRLLKDWLATPNFGLDPGIDSTQWSRATTRIGLTDTQNGIDLFGLTSQIKVNAVVGASNFEKGAAFFRALDNDTTSTATNRAVVAYDALAEIAAGNTNGQVWSGVNRYQVDATGDGSAYGIEFDGTNNGTAVNNHGDSGLKTKIPIWIASAGSQPSSWMFDSAAGGPGFQNGIAIRNIVASGLGIELPNNIGAYWRNQANNADVRAVIVDTSNNLVLGGSNNAGIFFQVNGSGVGSNTGSGWTNMTIAAPSISDATMSSTKNSGQCTLNGGTPATCTATVLSGSRCVATPNGTTAAAATHTVATSVTTTTLTVTGANGLVDVVNYHCF